MTTASIRPWGKSALIGENVSSLALGIGMRWRETVVQLVERRPDPDFELDMYRRCVLSHNNVRLLKDLGVTEKNLMRVLRPARRWRFVSNDLEVIREGDSYAGCAPAEAVYHTTEGQLLRLLRREFLRFGGYISWATEAHEVVPLNDDEGLWELHRDWGTAAQMEFIGTSARHTPIFDVLYGLEEMKQIPTIDYDVSSGFTREAPEPVLDLFKPDVDFCVALGKGFILHMFKPWLDKPLVSWRMTQPLNSDLRGEIDRQDAEAAGDPRDQFHPGLRRMMATSKNVLHDTARLPSRPSPIYNDAREARLTVLGDALYPVDEFELRGDRALVAIEDASAFCRRLYQTRYSRGFAPLDMREHEFDAVAKRAQLMQRDAHDVEAFLEATRPLPKQDAGEEPRSVDEGDGSKADASAAP